MRRRGIKVLTSYFILHTQMHSQKSTVCDSNKRANNTFATKQYVHVDLSEKTQRTNYSRVKKLTIFNRSPKIIEIIEALSNNRFCITSFRTPQNKTTCRIPQLHCHTRTYFSIYNEVVWLQQNLLLSITY